VGFLKFASQVQNGRQPPLSQNDTLLYFRNGLSDFDEIWYGDAHQLSNLMGNQKLKKIENPRWRTVAILKIEKSQYL